MNIRTFVVSLFVALSMSACSNPQASVVITTTTVSPYFSQIASYWTDSALKAETDDDGKNPVLYLSVITDTATLDMQVIRNIQKELSTINLKGNVLVMVEWGMYFSGGIRVDITDVQPTASGVDITVVTQKPNPKEPQAQAFSSAFAFATIPRHILPTEKPATFTLIHEGVPVVTQTVSLE